MRGIRWGTLVLVVVEGLLLVTGRLALGHAVLLVVCVETSCAIVVLSVAGSRYHRSRRLGRSSGISAADAASAVLPGPVFRLVAREAQLLVVVGRWLLRRPIKSAASGSGNAVPIAMIGYGRDQVAFVWIILALTVLEFAVIGIVVPWTALRVILLVLGVYGLLMMAGFVAANRTRPHILTSDSLLYAAGYWQI